MARRVKVREFGKSLSVLTGTNNVDCGATDFIGTGDITVTFWAKIRGLGGSNAGHILDNGKFIISTRTVGTPQISVQSDGATLANSALSSIILNKWQHFMVTRTSAGVVNIYINGVLSGTANQSSGTPAAGTTDVFIGNTTALNRNLNGLLDNMRIFNRILTSVELLNVYYDETLPPDSTTSQLAFYNFYDNVLDQTGNGHNGTLTGATYSPDVPYRTRVKVQPTAKCIDFASGTDSINTGTDWLGIGALTISAWVFPRSTGGAGGGRIIDNNKIIFSWGSSNRLAFQSNAVSAVSANNAIVFNTWQHVAVTRDAAGVTTLYFNGQTNGVLGQSSGTPASGSTTFIGNSSGANRGFDGQMQDVRVHNRVLTQDEITALWASGQSPNDGSLLRRYTFDNTLTDTTGAFVGTATGTTFSSNVRSAARNTASNRLSTRGFGTALLFGNTTTDNVTITNTSGQVYDNLSPLTVTMWINANTLKASDFVFAIPATGGNNRRYINFGSGGLINLNIGNTSVSSTGQNFIRTNQWYFIVARFDTAGLTADAYVNNVQWIAPTAWTLGSGNANVIIGDSQTVSQEFQGVIDEVRMYNRILTTTEIANMYYGNVIPRDSALIGEWLFNEGSGSTANDTSGKNNNGTITGATYTTNVRFLPRTFV